jgi:hypothetical protein
MKTKIILTIICLAIGLFIKSLYAQGPSLQELQNEEAAYLTELQEQTFSTMNWKDIYQLHGKEIELFMSVRAFEVISDIDMIRSNSQFIKSGGGIGVGYGNGVWSVNTRFSIFYTAFQEQITTNMNVVGMSVQRRFFLNVPVVIYTGVGVDFKHTIFEGHYHHDFIDAGRAQVVRQRGSLEPRLGTVQQFTPHAKMGVEYHFRGFDSPFSVFVETDYHMSGMSQSNYIAFQNTHVGKDVHFSFGFRIRRQ